MRASGICLRFFLALLAVAPTAVPSQPIYRCGNAYSQTPCANAVVVKADDARTPDQKAQTDAATAQAARLAERMERDRMASEHRPGLAGNRPASVKAASASGPRSKSKSKSKSPPPDYFTAAARPDEKKKALPAQARD